MDETTVIALVNKAVCLPFVKIDREMFLKKEFNSGYEDKMDDILKKGPYKAGVPIDIIRKKCEDAINYETNKATGVSFAAGILDGIAIPSTISADVAQSMGHMVRICQKLAYLSGYQTFSLEKIEDNTANEILICLQTMFYVEGANLLLRKIITMTANHANKQIVKQALTKTAWYQILKKIATQIGMKITKKTLGNAVTKVEPILGNIASVGLTYFTLKQMSNKLKETLIENLLNENTIDVENTLKEESTKNYEN